jgi:hypothetical protein
MIGFAIAAIVLIIVTMLEDKLDLGALEQKRKVNRLADESIRKERKKNRWR